MEGPSKTDTGETFAQTRTNQRDTSTLHLMLKTVFH